MTTSADDAATPSDKPAFNLGEAFRARQEQLESALGLGRTVTHHPSTPGDASELDWRGMLADFLPRRYGVTKGFVVDVRGGISDQIDLVIHDRHYCPLLFEVGGAHFIPAESVYVALEIKQDISKAHLEYAGAKVASVRRLERTSVGFSTATGPALARTPPRILGGVLALDTSWNPMDGEPLRRALRERSEEEILDFGCVLRAGSFEAPHAEKPDELLLCDDPDTALIFFALRLLKRLQDMATVGAMDFDEYTRAVWPGTLHG